MNSNKESISHVPVSDGVTFVTLDYIHSCAFMYMYNYKLQLHVILLAPRLIDIVRET